MTSGSSTKKLAMGRDAKAKTIPKIPIETIVSPAERHPLLFASLGFSAPMNCPVKVAPATVKPWPTMKESIKIFIPTL